jgi:methionyl-tRNA formyltransferase
MGTPDFAVPFLHKIFSSHHRILGIVTQPDKPQGRGRRFIPSPVKKFALEKQIDKIWQPLNLKDENFVRDLRNLDADIFIVVAFRILPEAVFSLPPLGTINVHPSLLPRYRGAAPINWTIINGDRETGISVIKITSKIDAGGILLQKKIPVYEDETAGHLHDRLAELGSDLLVMILDQIQQDKISVLPQNDDLATPAPKLQKQDCHILFSCPAEVVKNRIHGLSPFPTAFVYLKGERINLYRARVVSHDEKGLIPGTVIKSDKKELWIACSPGILSLLEVQKEGKKRMAISEFLRGFSIMPGEIFQ